MKQMTIFDYPMELITNDTRRQSESKVDKHKRYQQIIEILTDMDKPMSAKEIAVEMHSRGYTSTSERNFSAPRITELRKEGIIECIGKGICKYTNKPVGLFKLRKDYYERKI